jgi:hypothetical protein
MRTRRTLKTIAATAAVALMVVLAVPGTAAAAYSSATPVVAAGCSAESVSGDAARAGSRVRGFVSFDGDDCGQEQVIHWFAGHDDDWRSDQTPYKGHVLAAARDGDASAVLYANGAGTFLGRRDAAGDYAAPRRLSRHGLTGAVIPSGDLIASGGRFWAVWNEQVGPGGEFAQTELFQSQNIGSGHYFDGVMKRTRITRSRAGDDTPTLVAAPLGKGEATYALAWSRNDGAQGERSVLRFARATADGKWAKTTFARRGYNAWPDLFAAKNALWLTWTRNNRPVVTHETAGGWADGKTFRHHRGMTPAVSVSARRPVVAWTSLRPRDVKVAERRDGDWSVRNLTKAGNGARQLLALTSAQGHATVLYSHARTGRVLAKTQQ